MNLNKKTTTVGETVSISYRHGEADFSDLVHVVRCKDCKWCTEHYDTDGNAPYWVCKNWDGGTDADGFCYEAERKDNG